MKVDVWSKETANPLFRNSAISSYFGHDIGILHFNKHLNLRFLIAENEKIL